jgi:hypothetical protein
MILQIQYDETTGTKERNFTEINGEY